MKNAHLWNRCIHLIICKEINVSLGDKPNQFLSHVTIICDWNSRKPELFLGLGDIFDCVGGGHDNWVKDKSLFIFLFVNKKIIITQSCKCTYTQIQSFLLIQAPNKCAPTPLKTFFFISRTPLHCVKCWWSYTPIKSSDENKIPASGITFYHFWLKQQNIYSLGGSYNMYMSFSSVFPQYYFSIIKSCLLKNGSSSKCHFHEVDSNK